MADLKTNVMRILEQKKIKYIPHEFDTADGKLDGITAASRIGKNPEEVFKTLVTEGSKGGNYVFVIPVCCELDLKKGAKSVGEKSIAMIKQDRLLPTTGYVHGGCSPIGMKKLYTTVFHSTAMDMETITVSAGKIGHQVELSPAELISLVRGKIADVTVEE